MAGRRDPADVFRELMEAPDDPARRPAAILPPGHPLVEMIQHTLSGTSPIPPGAEPIDLAAMVPVAAAALREMARDGAVTGLLDARTAMSMLSLARALDRLGGTWIGMTVAQVVMVYMADRERSFDCCLAPWMAVNHGALEQVAARMRELEARGAARRGWLARLWAWIKRRP